MTERRWDGIGNLEVFTDEGKAIRLRFADDAKLGKWTSLLAILKENPDLINSTRPGGRSLYAPLHQAAYHSAPIDVVEELLQFGAWRTLQNAFGERPIDIAEKRRVAGLAEILTPVMHRRIPWGILLKIQKNFHEVIRTRAFKEIEEGSLRLPELEPLLEFEESAMKFWFTVPGMYGGFSYWFERDGANAKLVTESWSRVCQGSGQRHEVKATGSKLVAEGFV